MNRHNDEGLQDGERGPQAKECGKLLEAGKDKAMNSPLEPPEGIQPSPSLSQWVAAGEAA